MKWKLCSCRAWRIVTILLRLPVEQFNCYFLENSPKTPSAKERKASLNIPVLNKLFHCWHPRHRITNPVFIFYILIIVFSFIAAHKFFTQVHTSDIVVHFIHPFALDSYCLDPAQILPPDLNFIKSTFLYRKVRVIIPKIRYIFKKMFTLLLKK